MQVLVIAPHQDDEILGCGGVMARHVNEGDTVHLLIITRGIPEIFPPEQIGETRQELYAANKLLGVSSFHFLDFPAPGLDGVPSYKIADAISIVIRAKQPQIVYLPHRGDIHSDHRIVFDATLVAARPINNCPVKKLLCYETLSETEWAPPFSNDAFIPTVFVDISNFLKSKLKAMACYQSQLKNSPHSRSLQSIEALARIRGGTVGVPAAEAFMLVRDIIK